MQIFQLLDLIFLEIFKREGKYNLSFGNLETTFNFIYNVYMKMAKTLTNPNAWTTFQAVDVEEWSLT
jgi:hypothetical protein